MKHLQKYENFNQIEFDYDKIINIIKEYGWGDAATNRFEDFENSKYFKNIHNEKDYAEKFDIWLTKISRG